MTEPDKTQIKLMKHFLRDNQNAFSDIKSALKEGDIKLAHRIVHTLKSGAGFIKKTELMEAARIVERSLKDGEAQVTEEQMNMLEQELHAVLTELAPLLNEQVEHVEHPEFPETEEAASLLDKLAVLLESGDPDCLELTDELRRIPGTENIIRQIEDFDFEPASETLEELRRSLEITSKE